jgi:CTP synthase (UTP-ammonia lyase)
MTLTPPGRLILIGQRDLAKPAHAGIEASIHRFNRETSATVTPVWMPADAIIEGTVASALHDAAGIWCTPGSPYRSTERALLAIRHARENQIPFLGTCGGFQHALMEYSRNVLGRSAAHQELDADAPNPLIVQLTCSLVGTKSTVLTEPGSWLATVLGGAQTTEEFNCNYGLSANLVPAFAGSDLRFIAHDELGQVRAFCLEHHPFFVGTLFQPERRALAGEPHPLVRQFLRHVARVAVESRHGLN